MTFDPHAAPTVALPGGKENDSWFEWLLATRHGGDAAYAAALQPMLDDIRGRLLDHARLEPGMRIADVGSGAGFAGFGTLERQPTSEITFVDISPALLAHARDAAQRRGVAERCRFINASAEALDGIADASIDIVLVRAVLAYLSDRGAAIREFRRILRPGGRISIVEPIFQDQAFAVAGLASQLRSGDCGPAGRYLELLHRWRSAHFPDSVAEIQRDPLTSYNERDLLRLLENAGFVEVHLRLHIDSIRALPMPWAAFLAGSPYADAPSMGEILQTRFAPDEQIEFERLFRTDIEAGATVERNVNAYLFAQTPPIV
jgi:arsenite methyltransferase